MQIPYLGDMHEDEKYRYFVDLMVWYYGSLSRAQSVWRRLLAADYFSKRALITENERIMADTINRLTTDLEVCAAQARRDQAN